VWDDIASGRVPTADRVDRVMSDDGLLLGADGLAAAREQLAARVLGAGPLDPLLEDPAVTDVLVNGTAGVWVDRGEGLQRAVCDVGDGAAVRRLAVRLAGLCGRRLDDASPHVDGLLPGGVRLHAVLPPLVAEGVHISLRVPRRLTMTLADLSRSGSCTPAWLPVLGGLVAARLSFVVSGGTGSGKTTLLGALLSQVPPAERLVLVEDVRELVVDHPHVVRLQSRPSNVEGRGEVNLTALVRQSLRMRPDRLVVGEVRGAEVRELLLALNTGHEGGCGTIHANSGPDVVARFEALGALAGMSRDAVHAQLSSAVQVIVHLRRRGAARVVDSIAVLRRGTGGGLDVVPALTRGERGEPAAGVAWPLLAALLDSAQAGMPVATSTVARVLEAGRSTSDEQPFLSPISPWARDPGVANDPLRDAGVPA